jgi:hypothetical protein
MKPGGGRYQASTQVKVLSPEIVNVPEADMLKIHGRQHSFLRIGEEERAWRGRRPLHDITQNR